MRSSLASRCFFLRSGGVDVSVLWRQRGAWFPYFDDAHAILFLAPISCFDEMLAEDRRVNRLEDSFLLWKGIVQSKLLAKCIIVRASLPRFSCFFPARARRANSI